MIAANLISPPEAALAVIGIRPIISRAVERIRVSTLREIDSLPRAITTAARAVVRGERFDATVGTADSKRYRAMLKDFARGYDYQQVEDMVDMFPAEFKALGTGLVVLASQVVQGLSAMYPSSSYQTVTGSVNLVPPEPKLWAFARVLDLLDQPMNVFSLIATGALLRSQTRAFRMAYPTIGRAIDAALVDEIRKAKVDKVSFRLPMLAETGMCSWMDMSPPGADASSLAQNHAAAGTAKEKTAARKEQSAKAKSQDFAAAATQSQKTQPVS
jgi:hypothetical protein